MNQAAYTPHLERVYNKMVKYLGHQKSKETDDMYARLERAFAVAYDTSLGHVRRNGDMLFSHIMQSVDLLLLIKPDVMTMEVMLLHETIKSCGLTEATLAERVGPAAAHLVQRFTELKKIRLHADTQEEVMQLREMLLVLAEDVRVILVKLATRMSGLLTLEGTAREKQIRLAKEMLEIYAPLAGRLGVYALKVRIEDEAFRVLHPKLYQKTASDLQLLNEEHPDILLVCKQEIAQLMQHHKLSGKIYGRIKSVYSTAHKMHQKHFDHPAELYDIFALRIVVDTKEDCYRLLGYVHEQFPPIAGRMKDYIASPKSNNYQSLHTAVTGMYPGNDMLPVEIQIRTRAMDDVAEYGIASHGAYKEMGSSTPDHGELWQQKLAMINREFKRIGRIPADDSTDFSRIIDKVFVITPKGDVVALPRHSTPLDFAYAIHSEVGHHCIGATVNEKAVPLSYQLKTGDVVSVVTRASHKPTGTSLLYAKTPNARSRIQAFLREAQRETFIERGRKLVDQALASVGKEPLDPSMSQLDALLGDGELKISGKERLLLKVGKSATTALSVVRKIYPDLRLGPDRKILQATVVRPEQKQYGEKAYIVGGDPAIPYALAKCCDQKIASCPATDLVAYISTQHTIRLHHKDCVHIRGKDPKRFLSVQGRI